MDGLSFRGLIKDGRSRIGKRRPLLIEFENKPKSRFTCAYEGVRVPGAVYIEHVSIPDPRTRECRRADELEYYDLKSDPHQLVNELPNRGDVRLDREQRRLRRKLEQLRDCRGVRGRDPRPGAGRSFCA